MVLFYENESKYFALLTDLINNRESFTSKVLEDKMQAYCHETEDYNVTDLFFNGENIKTEDGSPYKVKYFFEKEKVKVGEKVFDRYEKNKALEHIPVAFSNIELQAAKNMVNNRNAERFLKKETLEKMATTFNDVPDEWSEDDVIFRRRYKVDGNPEMEIENDVKIIADAIRNGKSIIYDYKSTKGKQTEKVEAYPVKLYYSNISNLFSADVYKVSQVNGKKYTTIRLIDIQKLQPGKKNIPEDLPQKYLVARKEDITTVKLRVQPIHKAVERCFMMFSYLNRTATYDAEKDEYILEIEYLKREENELKRNILSLGSAVTVLEPADMREKIIDRIRKTIDNYEM